MSTSTQSVDSNAKFGYAKDGKQKRILLNAFDMNGVGHIRLAVLSLIFHDMS